MATVNINIDTSDRNSVRDAFVMIEAMYLFQIKQLAQLQQQAKEVKENGSASDSKQES